MEDNSRYYVKYEVSVAFGGGSLHTTEITYLSDEGEQTITIPSSDWEGTYGPFPKGTSFYIKVGAYGAISNRSESYVRLLVSKDKEPFVIKDEDRGISKSFFQADYTIDF